MDVIEVDRQLWLVPQWIPNPNGMTKRPERMVSLETTVYTRHPGAHVEFVLHNPVPRSVLRDPLPTIGTGSYIVREHLDLEFPIDTTAAASLTQH
jgi:hypothetical protein